MEIKRYREFRDLASQLDGVFTIKDLEIAFQERSRAGLFRTIDTLIENEELFRVKRGIYATPEASLATVSARIIPESYISTGTVLAKNGIIGSLPAKKIQAIRVGDPRRYVTPIGIVEYLSIAPKLFFGFERSNDCNWASPEKAFLDLCYYFYKGKKFSFDPVTDINYEILDLKKVRSSLTKFDQRFVTYFNNMWVFDE